MTIFDQQYDFNIIEKKLQQYWQDTKIYKWDSTQSRANIFSIDTPPPTVSGTLHIGHIFSFTQTDFIARFQRMSGKTVFYPMGFDDNGLPTERLVEKLKDVKACQIPREEFIKLCKEVIVKAEGEFRELFESIALSIDWSLGYQTISKKSCTISQMSFIDLHNKGYLKRDFSPTFWDPIDKTAISQAEIDDKEKPGQLSDIKFKLHTNDANYTENDIIIATTRPELISACVALLYHPKDERYNKLSTIGIENAIIPIINKIVPLLADEDVEMEKGSGVVMSCTFGDIQDVYWWKRHNLNLIQCIDLDGRMQNTGIFGLDGMKVNEARNKMLEILKNAELLIAQTNVTRMVKCAERSGAPLELIPTNQWYITVMDYKNELLEKTKECNWYPEYMRIRLENWINGLNQDWCISRQRYFGVPFPVWYSKRKGEEGKILLAEKDQLPVNPLVDLPKGYTKEEVVPDGDVMDTWATSALTPDLSTGYVSENYQYNNRNDNEAKSDINNTDINISSKDMYEKLYPFDLHPQAHEIIRVWAFGAIVKAMIHKGQIPWYNLMISGWCLASDKTKMSKSKGNGATPNDLILKYGADIVRYWTSGSKLGTDIIYSEDAFKIGKKLVNKLWNASKLCNIHISNLEIRPKIINNIIDIKNDLENKKIICTADLWILNKLYETLKNVADEFKKFEYYTARCIIEDFFWNDFCDNYLELVKKRLYNEELKNKSGIFTIYYCLYGIIHALAPIMPYITEELYQIMFVDKNNFEESNVEESSVKKSIHQINSWPRIIMPNANFKMNIEINADENIEGDIEGDIEGNIKVDGHIVQNENINKCGDIAIQFLNLVRKFKSEHNLALNSEIKELILINFNEDKLNLDQSILDDLKGVTNAKSVMYCQKNDNANNGDGDAVDDYVEGDGCKMDYDKIISECGKYMIKIII